MYTRPSLGICSVLLGLVATISAVPLSNNRNRNLPKGAPGTSDISRVHPPGEEEGAPPGWKLTEVVDNSFYEQNGPPGSPSRPTRNVKAAPEGPPGTPDEIFPPGFAASSSRESRQKRSSMASSYQSIDGPIRSSSIFTSPQGPERDAHPPAPRPSSYSPPGSHNFVDSTPASRVGQPLRQPAEMTDPIPNTGIRPEASQMVASYASVEGGKPIGIREPDTNMTIDQIITKVLGGPRALHYSSMVSENGTILAELDMRLTVDQYLSLYDHRSSQQQGGEREFVDVGRYKRKAIADTRLRWTKRIIPYEFVYSDFNEQEIAIIKASMDEWESSTCLHFVPARPWHYNKIRFQNGRGCNSQVGMVGGTQAINLDQAGCRWRGLYLHEIAHAIGLVHEHQRPDRDDYIYILYDKVDPNMKEWFNKYKRDQVNDYGVEYDPTSVMHYGVTAFSADGKSKTIKTLDPSLSSKVGIVRFKQLAFSDKHIVNLMYGCGDHCPSSIKCIEGGYMDKDCKCQCPDETQNCYLSGQPAPEREDEECSDVFSKDDCDRWSDYGECYLNVAWMTQNCKKTCRRCAKDLNNTVYLGCEDSKRKCVDWQEGGECENNPGWMLHHCPKACGKCGQEGCRDEHKDGKMCEFWANTGECEKNQAWMTDNCRKACGKCPDRGQCVDLHNSEAQCRKWAGRAECKTNPNWMGLKCKKSCGLCEDQVRNRSVDNCRNSHSDDECVQWAAEGECRSNPAWMMRRCRKSCTKCLAFDVDDEDKCLNVVIDDELCDAWARSGECTKNPIWMKRNCKKSCKRCKKHEASSCINFYLDEEECDRWASEGQCESNEVWMRENCNRSCSQCTEKRACTNSFSDEVQCEEWARLGECHANREWMMSNCYIACTDCDGGNRTRGRSCINRHSKDEKCDQWADLGECTHNRDWMMSKCFRSCSECDGIKREDLFPCENSFRDDDLCMRWASKGLCTKNRRWMLKNCRAACKRCKGGPTYPTTTTTPLPATTTSTTSTTTQAPSADCYDTHYDKRMCRVWAANRQCRLNPSWMLANCKLSCGECRPPATTTKLPVVTDSPDEDDDLGGEDDGSGEDGDGDGDGDILPTSGCRDDNINCPNWASGGMCHSSIGYMYYKCKRSCGLCEPGRCRDRNTLCPVWARTRSYCRVNAEYMLSYCPKSCGLCDF